MVSKNNVYAKQLLNAKRVPHYGLRKLSIGVASVLLSTGLYFGMNGTVANADEVTSGNDTGTDASQTGAGIANAGKTAVIGNHQSQTNAVQSGNNNVSSSAANNSINENHSAAASAGQSESKNSNISSLTNSASAGSNVNSQTTNSASAGSQSVSSATMSSIASSMPANENNSKANTNILYTMNFKQQAKPQSLVANNVQNSGQQETTNLSDGSTVTTDSSLLSEGHRTVTFTFKSNNFKAGDTYTFKIPKMLLDSRLSQSTIGLQTLLSNDVGSLSGYGTTTFDMTSDPNNYLVIDKFNKAGTIQQPISFLFDDFAWKDLMKKPDSVYPGEKFQYLISVTKNGQSNGQIDVTYQLPQRLSMNIDWDLASKSAVRSDDHFNPTNIPTTGLDTLPIPSNYSLPYTLTISELLNNDSIPNGAMNHGAIVNIPVPQYFKLDTSVPLTLTNSKDAVPSGITITQKNNEAGQPLQITIPAGVDLSRYNKFNFNGIMQVPNNILLGSKVAFQAPAEATLTQSFVDSSNQTGQQFPLRTIYVVPLAKNVSDGSIFAVGKVTSANYERGTEKDGSIKVAGKNNNLYASDTANYWIANVFSQSETAKIHIDYASGLNVTSISMKMYNNDPDSQYQEQVTYQNGSTQSFTGLKTIEGNNIKSIDVVISKFSPKAVFNIYPSTYNIADNITATSLRTTLSVDGDSNEGHQVDMIVPKPTTELFMKTNFKSFQSSTNPGDKSGYLGYRIDVASNIPDVTKLIKPIFYIKLPDNALLLSKDSQSIDIKVYRDDLGRINALTPQNFEQVKIGSNNYLKIDLSNYPEIDVPSGYFLDMNIYLINKYDAQTTNDSTGAFVVTQNAKEIKNLGNCNILVDYRMKLATQLVVNKKRHSA